MIWIFIGTLAMATALIKLDIATVMVSVLLKLLTVALAFFAVLLTALLWQSWRQRR